MRATKLTPAEAKWATPVVKLWNTLNAGLLVVVSQATAKDALFVGTKTNQKLTLTLATFVTCSKALKTPGAAPARLAKFGGSMKSACTNLEAGAHDFAKAIGAIRKGNGTLTEKLVLQGIGEFKRSGTKLAAARNQLLAVSR